MGKHMGEEILIYKHAMQVGHILKSETVICTNLLILFLTICTNLTCTRVQTNNASLSLQQKKKK